MMKIHFHGEGNRYSGTFIIFICDRRLLASEYNYMYVLLCYTSISAASLEYDILK